MQNDPRLSQIVQANLSKKCMAVTRDRYDNLNKIIPSLSRIPDEKLLYSQNWL